MLQLCSASLCVRCCSMHAKNMRICPQLALIPVARQLHVQDIFDGWGSYVHNLQICDVFQGNLSCPMRGAFKLLYTTDPKPKKVTSNLRLPACRHLQVCQDGIPAVPAAHHAGDSSR